MVQGRSLVRSTLLIVATIAAGLTLRLVRLGFPSAVVKYGGSILWALMVYWFIMAIRPRWPPTRSALVSSVVALSVELFKLHHAPALDAFRLTLPGKLLLGRVFSSWDLLAYAAAILVGLLLDRAVPAALRSSALERVP